MITWSLVSGFPCLLLWQRAMYEVNNFLPLFVRGNTSIFLSFFTKPLLCARRWLELLAFFLLLFWFELVDMRVWVHIVLHVLCMCAISGNVLGIISSQWLQAIPGMWLWNQKIDDGSLFSSPRAFVPVKAAFCRHVKLVV